MQRIQLLVCVSMRCRFYVQPWDAFLQVFERKFLRYLFILDRWYCCHFFQREEKSAVGILYCKMSKMFQIE